MCGAKKNLINCWQCTRKVAREQERVDTDTSFSSLSQTSNSYFNITKEEALENYLVAKSGYLHCTFGIIAVVFAGGSFSKSYKFIDLCLRFKKLINRSLILFYLQL